MEGRERVKTSGASRCKDRASRRGGTAVAVSVLAMMVSVVLGLLGDIATVQFCIYGQCLQSVVFVENSHVAEFIVAPGGLVELSAEVEQSCLWDRQARGKSVVSLQASRNISWTALTWQSL